MDKYFLRIASAAIILAVCGAFVAHMGHMKMMYRKEKLDRVNRQLKDLYGPLYGLTLYNETIWKQLVSSSLPLQSLIDSTETVEERYQRQNQALSASLQTDKAMYNIIINNSDLFVENEFPQSFKDFCVYEESFWPEGVQKIECSHGIHCYVQQCYDSLKKEQHKLLEN